MSLHIRIDANSKPEANHSYQWQECGWDHFHRCHEGSNPRIQQGYESFVLVGWGETHGPPLAFYGELVAQGRFVVEDEPEYHQKDQ